VGHQAQPGVVAEFDEAVGLGTVRSDDGVTHPFHCTAIADGSRTIEPGTAVTFAVVAGHQGLWEATAVTPRPGSA
jgi:cold shock CspA family protein